LNGGVVEFKDGDTAWRLLDGPTNVTQAYVLNGQVHTLSGSDPEVAGSVMAATVGVSPAFGSNSANWATVIADSNKVAL
jgi:hypothetical protein